MKIVALSDTHFPKKKNGLPQHLTEELKKADHIIHAGDFTKAELLDELMSYAPVSAVYGNVDEEDVKKRLDARICVHLGGMTVGIVHGHEGHGRTTKERAIHTFLPNLPQIIVFGHSHIPLMERMSETVLINPGSPTDKRREKYFSYAIIRSNDRSIKCELVLLDEYGKKVKSIYS
ncbi:metallophosphoesterase family protein [Fictibacillus iocasae]|uniref:Phosphoesterase n=1 Tax=Fictibacillus iocasae TaxID=2715437 RepID=A0ABW2NJN0_9BACL